MRPLVMIILRIMLVYRRGRNGIADISISFLDGGHEPLVHKAMPTSKAVHHELGFKVKPYPLFFQIPTLLRKD